MENVRYAKAVTPEDGLKHIFDYNRFNTLLSEGKECIIHLDPDFSCTYIMDVEFMKKLQEYFEKKEMMVVAGIDEFSLVDAFCIRILKGSY